MRHDFFVDENGLAESHGQTSNYILMVTDDKREMTAVRKQYALPEAIFLGADAPEEALRYEDLPGTRLTDAKALVVMDLDENNDERIEKRLQPVTMVVAKEGLLMHLVPNSALEGELLAKNDRHLLRSPARVIGAVLQLIGHHFVHVLKSQKKAIDHLDQAARKTTRNQELFQLADLSRDMVYLEHTLDDQRDVLDKLLADADFSDALGDSRLAQNILQRHRYAVKMVTIYRDLLETSSSLFSAMMDNRLNHLMRYLDSAALVVSVPAMIGGLWGMNVGGIPGDRSWWGFLIMTAFALLMGGLTALHLMRKDFHAN
ncbi:magnesium transporter CorA family protein [Lacticaseibacillus mingshuiensis]|uniref:Magnesium transporter CorA family protein n=1 Tax=Lacticaseibacillus mingshuiensis TaxID=2799574 RepID=A0ABW4CKG1_9LACO|nr:magnesium transporter CorA family protein [Lacticaseibacillus mingshuiensis]